MASTAALCVLEVRVHLDLPFSLIPDDYVLMTINLDNLEIQPLTELPADTVAAGNHWLAEGHTPVLKVPSLIVAESTNLLLNPAHPAAVQAKNESIRPFSFDQRLWSSI